ncbi:TnsA endonuclease N-terminal domain-containing protein [Paraburkholderia sacchari]|uniref:TnsA endonuclease N-terminal domain-containing protein n=1 Tax=Paraburkholderia sacchari TaxID=159450 RepID=UPI001BD19ADB|nr:TnsA endonuclease N-terminal domain-containing protein [Paraburkholderia sacchari]
MATKSKSASLDFAFFNVLWHFYKSNRGSIRAHYKELSRKFIDFNNPERNPKVFLRQPQFEALEMYVFLKEFLGNAKVEEIFQSWFEKKGRFADRSEGGVASGRAGQVGLFDVITQEQYGEVFASMRKNSRVYPNYIFALTMGTGKTILMATCIFYEFLLGNKFEKDERFCHNALVFAPDRTVLQALKEIESFDMTRVVPPEYVNFLNAHLRFHFLEEAGTSLDTLDKSRFNIIVSNTQKIILKRQHKDRSATEKLFGDEKPIFNEGSVYASASDLYDFAQPEEEGELTTNQRFEKLCRLEQLGIFVDEAHHAFGKALAKDMGIGSKEADTSLRTTIDSLAASLIRAGTRVVACYNFTGTPYVGSNVLPEVVYAYGLKEAIDKGFLKKVVLHGYTNTVTDEFVDIAVESFLKETANVRPEGMLPKLAFFAATIDEVKTELRPALERALERLRPFYPDIPPDPILVNVGDEKLTGNDEIREFNRLDTQDSGKQFILLVNKGREGWNCRSLFGVGLFRQPKSKVFVLQATMRCLRAVGGAQHTGHVFLSNDNLEILNEELLQNFRISAEELQNTASERERVQVRVVEPPVKIKLRRVRKIYTMREKQVTPGMTIGIDPSDREKWGEMVERYRLIETQQSGLTAADAARASANRTFDHTSRRLKREFSRLSFVAEVARYLNRSPLQVERILDSTKEGTDTLVAAVNQFNELLYDEVIPRLFSELYDLDPSENIEEHEVDLIKLPPNGYYEMTGVKGKILRMGDVEDAKRAKSFHLDTYCFDSNPEQTLFWDLLREEKIKRLYFTGMLTHGQSDFFVQYIDPDSHTVRSYYPDFLFEREDGTYVIVEVKADNQIEDAVVQAKKEFANQMAVASGMEYRLIKASDANARHYRMLL